MAFAIGYVFALRVLQLGQRELLLGRDGRESGLYLHRALIKGIRSADVKVLDLGMTTTPVVGFACCQPDLPSSGIMITASHNPASYNGFKFVLNGTIFADIEHCI